MSENGTLSVLLFVLFVSLVNSVKTNGAANEVSSLEKFNKPDFTEDWVLTPWINDNFKFGQISGVSVDPDDNIYIFHRGDIVWTDTSFRDLKYYTGKDLGPIKESTILVFNNEGALLKSLGKNKFYMPHGITVDNDFNIWVTDVALHQVMKFAPRTDKLLMVLGEKFIPGNDSVHFCKPTSVAVTYSGDFFVSDGYCNSRIIKFNSDGKKILEWGRNTNNFQPPGMYDMFIPHALTIAEDKGLLCSADRENGRVVCYRINNGTYVFEISNKIMGSRIFSVTYSSSSGGRLYVVNGRSSSNIPVQGYVLNLSGKILGTFGKNLHNPHDIAVLSNDSVLYVVELKPFKAWKYVNKNPFSAHESTLEEENIPSAMMGKGQSDNVEGLTGAVLVTIACFVFSIAILIGVVVYSKNRKSPNSDTRRLLSNIEY